MAAQDWTDTGPDVVLEFWFPDDGHQASVDTHRAFWEYRMRGGADSTICERFAELTQAAAFGLLDHWAETPRGRLALIIALDQFPRSLWRDTPAAYAQDIKATRLAMEGRANGHYAALSHAWEKQFYNIAIAHCEGPDHRARMEDVLASAREIAAEAPEHLRQFYSLGVEHNETVCAVIDRFGRHPHRNAVLGRASTPDEQAYVAAGEFPHQRDFPETL